MTTFPPLPEAEFKFAPPLMERVPPIVFSASTLPAAMLIFPALVAETPTDKVMLPL